MLVLDSMRKKMRARVSVRVWVQGPGHEAEVNGRAPIATAPVREALVPTNELAVRLTRDTVDVGQAHPLRVWDDEGSVLLRWRSR